MILRLLDVFNDVLIQPFLPDGAVVALDIGVLLGLAGLDMQDAPLRANKSETFDCLKFTLEGAGERPNGNA